MKNVCCEDCRYWDEKDHRGMETDGTFEAVCKFRRFEKVKRYTAPNHSCEKGKTIHD